MFVKIGNIEKMPKKNAKITKVPVAMKIGAIEAHADVFQLHIHGLELVFDSPAKSNNMVFHFGKKQFENLNFVETLPGFTTKSKQYTITSQSRACHQNHA